MPLSLQHAFESGYWRRVVPRISPVVLAQALLCAHIIARFIVNQQIQPVMLRQPHAHRHSRESALLSGIILLTSSCE